MKKEVQGHGLIWENSILRNIYGATEEELKKYLQEEEQLNKK